MMFRTLLTNASNRMEDFRLLKRVRSELGHVSSHPKAMDVQVNHGTVTLRGPVFNTEVVDILTGVESVRGVHAVQYELDGYDSADGASSLRLRSAVGTRDDSHHRWAPAARAAVTAGLVATGAWAMMRARA